MVTRGMNIKDRGQETHMPKDREKALQALLCFCMRYPDGNQQGLQVLLGMTNETASVYWLGGTLEGD